MVNPSTAPALFSVQDAFKGPYAGSIPMPTKSHPCMRPWIRTSPFKFSSVPGG